MVLTCNYSWCPEKSRGGGSSKEKQEIIHRNVDGEIKENIGMLKKIEDEVKLYILG